MRQNAPDLRQSSRSRPGRGCNCLKQGPLQARRFRAGSTDKDDAHADRQQPSNTHTRQGVSFRHGPVPQAVCFFATPVCRLSAPQRFEPDPVQYVPAWHRLHDTEEVPPANMPSDAECTRPQRVERAILLMQRLKRPYRQQSQWHMATPTVTTETNQAPLNALYEATAMHHSVYLVQSIA